MALEAVLLSRAQMGFTLAFHIIFPTFTIGLALFLAVLEEVWLATGRPLYLQLYRYWLRLFGVAFAIGVVSGVVIAYEFGTNFGGFSAATGAIVGPLMSYEVLTAFFLESGFLGIMLFGRNRVGRGVHFFATAMVALGTVISTFWIMAANSWMQTPAGYLLVNGQFEVANWTAALFNPSFPYRLVHMVLAALDATSFAVAGASAWHLVRGQHRALAGTGLSFALWMAIVVAPAQVAAGDQNGEEVRHYQPMKLAAIEAVWETEQPAPLVLFALPDQQAALNRFAVTIPHLGSLILTHSWNGALQGLRSVPPSDRPDVVICFFAFRIMAGLGFLMWFAAWASLWLRWRGRLETTRWFLWLLVALTPAGFIATVAGWVVAEVGRQPWVVQGLMRTTAGASAVPASQVATSLALFVLLYLVLIGAYLAYAVRWLRQGPPRVEDEPPPVENPLRAQPIPPQA
jgi:cytochrome d ubiquinol oxidase subunit I